jgi:SecD/SecF fusion protein
VRENVPRMPRAAFSQIVNRSMSEVLTRSLATSFCTLLPVLSLLLFGGSTLKDFAFALLVGIASGAYSSIFIASPVLTHWKEREGIYRNRRARIERDLGYVPAYATAIGDAPVDVEPPSTRKRGSTFGAFRASATPGDQVSSDEFNELVREIGPELAEQQTGRTPANVGSRRGRAAKPTQAAAPAQVNGAKQLGGTEDQSARRDPTADLTPEDLVMKDQPKQPKPRRPRNRRHGRSR